VKLSEVLLLPSIPQHSKLSGAFDFSRNVSLMFGAAAGLFAGEDLVLTTGKLA